MQAPGAFTRSARPTLPALLASTLALWLLGCGPPPPSVASSEAEPPRATTATIEFVSIPICGEGPHPLALASGLASAGSDGAAVVLYSQTASGAWFVQPFREDDLNLTPLADGQWRAEIHLGRSYAALLVNSEFRLSPETPAEVPTPPFEDEGVMAYSIADCTV